MYSWTSLERMRVICTVSRNAKAICCAGECSVLTENYVNRQYHDGASRERGARMRTNGPFLVLSMIVAAFMEDI